MKTKNQFEALRREKKPRILVEENLTNANGNSRSKVMVPEGACQRHSLPENYHQHSNSTVDNSNSSRDNLQKSYKISHQSKDVFYLEILEKTELEIEGNLKLIIVKGEIKVSGKVFKEGEKLKIYASVNHVTLNANDACLISIEKFEFDFNVKPLKELDQNFKLNRIRDILETKLSTTSKTSVIIGPVNSGKSTTARYLTNMYLNNYETVAFLDCDLGQPEFTPPGMISLTLVKDPLLGHPCTHLKIPKHSIFIGDTSPKRDPDSYITGLYKLVDIYRKECNGIPLVVNTSGWIRGNFFLNSRSWF